MTANNDNGGDDDEASPPKKPKASPRKNQKPTPANVSAAEAGDDKQANDDIKPEPDTGDDYFQ